MNKRFDKRQTVKGVFKVQDIGIDKFGDRNNQEREKGNRNHICTTFQQSNTANWIQSHRVSLTLTL